VINVIPIQLVVEVVVAALVLGVALFVLRGALRRRSTRDSGSGPSHDDDTES
jgi:hypothetical protein